LLQQQHAAQDQALAQVGMGHRQRGGTATFPARWGNIVEKPTST